MKIRMIVTLLIASLLALDGFAQRVDLGLNGFQVLADTQAIQGDYLVVITSSPSAGGAYRCIDFQGPARFGGIGFVPSRLNGQPNRGRGGIALMPYTERVGFSHTNICLCESSSKPLLLQARSESA